jgi:hypothetical protein
MTAYDSWKTEPNRMPGMHYHPCVSCDEEVGCDDRYCEAFYTTCEDCDRLQAHADDLGIQLED